MEQISPGLHPFVITSFPKVKSLAEDLNVTAPHIEYVTILQNNEAVQVGPGQNLTRRKIEIDPSRMDRHLRGSVVCITFTTEDGRRIHRSFRFQKGDVYFADEEGASLEDRESVGELWRD